MSEREPITGRADERPFWERPETVAWFAARPADERVTATFAGRPADTRILDIGCAAGRNTAWLASEGLDVHALDASVAMVERARTRLEAILGTAEAARRVRRGDMTDLSAYRDASFDAVVAIGLLPGAPSEDAWHRAVAEMARVLTRDGELLLTHFTPDVPSGAPPLVRVGGEAHLYRRAFDDRSAFLLGREALDALMARHGFVPHEPTRLVQATTMTGHRPVLNGHFCKQARPSASEEEHV